jgi:predicted nucleic acid-binding protein
VKAIADTGFLVAFANRNDRHHQWAVQVAEQVEAPLLTCEAVLAETAFHLRDSTVTLAMIADGLVRVGLSVSDHVDHLAKLARRFKDRQPDLTDLCLIRLSELHPRHAIVTVDERDFRVYRRNTREAIPLICPPS